MHRPRLHARRVCPQLEGFVGNRTDVTTLEEIIGRREERFGEAWRVWGMDRGRVSEKNPEFVRRRGDSLVGTSQSRWQDFAAERAEEENWIDREGRVEARLLPPPMARAVSASCSAAATSRRPRTGLCSHGRRTV
jgi:hypothetical protein